MTLQQYTKRHGLFTGPIRKGKKNTSHSSLEVIKKAVCGQEQFKGGEGFLYFGNALHERCLVKDHSRKVTPQEAAILEPMAEAFAKHVVVQALMKGAICEQKFYVNLNGVKVAVILDIKKLAEKLGADLKTTNCKSMVECIEKAILYGYFRQAVTYIKAALLKKFFFIFITKSVVPQVFILDVSKFKDEMKYAEQELAWLLYMFKNYGKPILR